MLIKCRKKRRKETIEEQKKERSFIDIIGLTLKESEGLDIYTYIEMTRERKREVRSVDRRKKERESRYKKQDDVSGRPEYLRREIKVEDKGGENLTVR